MRRGPRPLSSLTLTTVIPVENANPINVKLLAKPLRCHTPEDDKEEFRSNLYKRDGCCPFSHFTMKRCATHIIPLSKGEEVCTLSFTS